MMLDTVQKGVVLIYFLCDFVSFMSSFFIATSADFPCSSIIVFLTHAFWLSVVVGWTKIRVFHSWLFKSFLCHGDALAFHRHYQPPVTTAHLHCQSFMIIDFLVHFMKCSFPIAAFLLPYLSFKNFVVVVGKPFGLPCVLSRLRLHCRWRITCVNLIHYHRFISAIWTPLMLLCITVWAAHIRCYCISGHLLMLHLFLGCKLVISCINCQGN